MSDERRIPREFEREMVHTETLVVESRESEGGRALGAQSRNMSASGIYVDTSDPPAVGTEVQLFIGSVATSSALRVIATVVHVEPGQGFGARFVDDSPEARAVVQAFLARFRKRP